MSQPDDRELVDLVRNGDTRAYCELVARYQGHVYGLAFTLVKNWVEAQDIAQETFIRAYMNLDQLRDPAKFAAWLRRVAFSVAMNWLKAFRPRLFEQLNGRANLDYLDIADFQPGPSEVVERRELAHAVMRAVESLPPKYRIPLTMFHLDGLSYKKVADFLDIPIGTAKSLINRARHKLKPYLTPFVSEEVSLAIGEVFNEHKLSSEFAYKVLESISELRWENGECTFCGSVFACMDFIGEGVTYDYLMGVSGSAFKLFWHPDWRANSHDLLILGEEPIRRTFMALGYNYRFVQRTSDIGTFHTENACREQIINSIHLNRPVVALGDAGPLMCSVIAGYGNNGDVLFSQSYFHDDANGYCRKSNWYSTCHGLILIQNQKPRPSKIDMLRASLEYAVQLALTQERQGYVSGLAAYDTWSNSLKCDEAFPGGDLDIVTSRCHVSNSCVLPGLVDARKAAAAFLETMASAHKLARFHILQAAKAYQEEVSILNTATDIAPLCTHPTERRAQMTDPVFRDTLANLILEARKKDKEAVGHLEDALQAIIEH